jgi:hypothetical protein
VAPGAPALGVALAPPPSGWHLHGVPQLAVGTAITFIAAL